MMQQPSSLLGRLIFEIPKSHKLDTHIHSVWLLRTSDQFLTENTTNTRRTNMPSAGFEPLIPAVEQLQTYTLDHMAFSIGTIY